MLLRAGADSSFEPTSASFGIGPNVARTSIGRRDRPSSSIHGPRITFCSLDEAGDIDPGEGVVDPDEGGVLSEGVEPRFSTWQ